MSQISQHDHALFSDNNGLQCEKELILRSGKFRTPYFPSKYPDNYDLRCLAHISTPVGSTIEVTFIYFDVEHHSICQYDAVEVRYVINKQCPKCYKHVIFVYIGSILLDRLYSFTI